MALFLVLYYRLKPLLYFLSFSDCFLTLLDHEINGGNEVVYPLLIGTDYFFKRIQLQLVGCVSFEDGLFKFVLVE